MIEPPQVITLREAMHALELATCRLDIEAKGTLDGPRLERLEAAVASLDGASKAARPPVGLEEYARQWQDYLGGKLESIEARAVRNLCWHPETATSDTFQYYLDRYKVSLNSRALQGLVRSCHARWSQEFTGANTVGKVRARLESYEGPSRLLAKWKQASTVLLGPDGAERFGDAMLEECVPVKTFCQRWGIADEFSAYVQAGVAHATEVCRRDMDRVPALREYLLTQLL